MEGVAAEAAARDSATLDEVTALRARIMELEACNAQLVADATEAQRLPTAEEVAHLQSELEEWRRRYDKLRQQLPAQVPPRTGSSMGCAGAPPKEHRSALEALRAQVAAAEARALAAERRLRTTAPLRQRVRQSRLRARSGFVMQPEEEDDDGFVMVRRAQRGQGASRAQASTDQWTDEQVCSAEELSQLQEANECLCNELQTLFIALAHTAQDGAWRGAATRADALGLATACTHTEQPMGDEAPQR